MAGDSGSHKKGAKRASVISNESKIERQFSKKMLTKQEDLSEDSGSRRAGMDTPSGLRTSRSRKVDDDPLMDKEELAKMARAFGHTQQKKKP